MTSSQSDGGGFSQSYIAEQDMRKVLSVVFFLIVVAVMDMTIGDKPTYYFLAIVAVGTLLMNTNKLITF